MPQDFTYVWNIKNKTNKQTNNTEINSQIQRTFDDCLRGGRVCAWVKKEKGFSSTNSRGWKV